MREEEAEDTTMSEEETAEENVEEREDTTMLEEEAEEEVDVDQQDRDLIRLSTRLSVIKQIQFHYELLMRRAGVVADAEKSAEEKMLEGFQQLLDMAADNPYISGKWFGEQWSLRGAYTYCVNEIKIDIDNKRVIHGNLPTLKKKWKQVAHVIVYSGSLQNLLNDATLKKMFGSWNMIKDHYNQRTNL